jgi:hypothetical protein
MTPAVINVDDARHSRRAGCRGGAAAPHGIVARTGSATANGLDLWAYGVSVATFDFRPDSCVLELASSDDLADAVSDQLARDRCVALRRAAACLDNAVPDDFAQVADWLGERAADGT